MKRPTRRSTPKHTPDDYVRGLIGHNANLLVPHYLMACYLYYIEDDPLITDALFDWITKRLMAEWETIEHWHKEYITWDDLVAGTGFALKYPLRVQCAAKRLRERAQSHAVDQP